MDGAVGEKSGLSKSHLISNNHSAAARKGRRRSQSWTRPAQITTELLLTMEQLNGSLPPCDGSYCYNSTPS